MKLRRLTLTLCIFVFATAIVHGAEPVTPNASSEARALLKAISRIAGRNTLSGQHNYGGTESKYSVQVQRGTGKWPAVWSSDFGYAASVENVVAEARQQFMQGSIVELTWRAVRPTEDEAAALKASVQGKLTDAQWQELLTEGSPLRTRWEAQVDRIAAHLKKLRDARIPVLWRPYPEANGSSYWWSNRPGEKGSSALYRQLFERLANHHKLTNLIWVWNAQAPGSVVPLPPQPPPYPGSAQASPPLPNPPAAAAEKFYPGPAYCDAVSVGMPDGNYSWPLYTSIMRLAGGKPIALDEVEVAPTPAILSEQPLWSWFTVGADALYRSNKPGPTVALFIDPRIVNRGNPLFTAAHLQTPEPALCEPVNPNATAEARALLKRICSISGKAILSGQHNFPNDLSKHSDATAKVAGKYPVIWGSDFGFTGGDDKDSIAGRDAMIEEAKRQHAAGSVITLMWHVVRPIDDEPVLPGAGWIGSIQNRLSDFEWNELLTTGTEMHRRWLINIDTAARYLKRLQSAKIPVIWRPYHEANGAWFWWGGRAGENGFAALYRMTYDRLVNYHQLDNLLWVWNSNAPTGSNVGPYADYYPGRRFCDILATDIYGEFKQSYHDDLAALAEGMPIALGEVGAVPSPAILKVQPRWAWFMIWADMLSYSKKDVVQELFSDPRTLWRDR